MVEIIQTYLIKLEKYEAKALKKLLGKGDRHDVRITELEKQVSELRSQLAKQLADQNVEVAAKKKLAADGVIDENGTKTSEGKPSRWAASERAKKRRAKSRKRNTLSKKSKRKNR